MASPELRLREYLRRAKSADKAVAKDGLRAARQLLRRYGLRLINPTARKYHRWTAAEISRIKAEYPDTRTSDLAAALGVPAARVYAMAKKLGVSKSAAYLASPAACRLRRGDEVGKRFRFPKGHVPANKGMRRPGWSPGRMRETQFRKGQRGRNWMPLGSERINSDGYLDRKVQDTGYPPTDWRAVHILLWEQHHGPVPAGHKVVFRNGNKRDVRLDNLELLSNAEMMRRNTIHRYPEEVKKAMTARGTLVRAINRRVSK